MALGLPVSRLINVTVNINPAAIPFANFDSLLAVGDSPVIDTQERIRAYGSLGEVADDFGTAAPEYAAASLFFGQTPQPASLFIGRWAHTATNGELYCGPLTVTEQQMANWTNITNGSFEISIDGTAHAITALTFLGTSNLNGVAAAIQTELHTAGATTATCIWNGLQFQFGSGTTGPASTVSYLTAVSPTSGVDISAQLKGTAALAQRNVAGAPAESALDAVIALDGIGTYWYGLTFASPNIVDADREAIAQYIEGANNKHVFGINTNNPVALTNTDNSSIGYVLKQAGYRRSFCMYSSTNPYAVSAFFGRAFTVDFLGSNTAITMMWQELAGITPEYLGTAQADALDTNNYNYLAEFNNQRAIVMNGKMCADYFFDEVWGSDWLAGGIQTALFDLLSTIRTKVPQTDSGIHMLTNICTATCAQAVVNGYVAPGQWNAAGFGILQTGEYLDKGFYVYAPPMATQPQPDREARKSPLIQIAVKLAGAIHTVDVLINVNR
jgi:hypothetical protein